MNTRNRQLQLFGSCDVLFKIQHQRENLVQTTCLHVQTASAFCRRGRVMAMMTVEMSQTNKAVVR